MFAQKYLFVVCVHEVQSSASGCRPILLHGKVPAGGGTDASTANDSRQKEQKENPKERGDNWARVQSVPHLAGLECLISLAPQSQPLVTK